jgi:hypothetical protein
MFQTEHVPGFARGCLIVDPTSIRMTDEILQLMITSGLWGSSLRGGLINDSNKKGTCVWRSERYKPSQEK